MLVVVAVASLVGLIGDDEGVEDDEEDQGIGEGVVNVGVVGLADDDRDDGTVEVVVDVAAEEAQGHYCANQFPCASHNPIPLSHISITSSLHYLVNRVYREMCRHPFNVFYYKRERTRTLAPLSPTQLHPPCSKGCYSPRIRYM